MKETPIFRNIQHVSRVWGTYPKLFATLGAGLLATTLGFVLTPGATAVVKVLVIGLGRTAYKLSQGDTDSMTSLIFAIVGIVLGFLANTFIV